MRDWTVFGVVNLDTGELIVAGVVEGSAPIVDTPIVFREDFSRWGAYVQAETWQQAEEKSKADARRLWNAIVGPLAKEVVT